jgi:hypothetical protein
MILLINNTLIESLRLPGLPGLHWEHIRELKALRPFAREKVNHVFYIWAAHLGWVRFIYN